LTLGSIHLHSSRIGNIWNSLLNYVVARLVLVLSCHELIVEKRRKAFVASYVNYGY